MGRFAFFTTSSATWSGSNNSTSLAAVTVTEAFIYSSTLPAIGGRVERSLPPTTVTTTIGGTVTLEVPLSFSATVSVSSQNGGGVYIGWMSAPTIANSRNFLGLFVQSGTGTLTARAAVWDNEGDGEQFVAEVITTTSVLSTNKNISFSYSPTGSGSMVISAFGLTSSVSLPVQIRSVGATMNAFGWQNVYWGAGNFLVPHFTALAFSTAGGTLRTISFATNPNFTGISNNVAYSSTGIQDNQSFGFTASTYANIVSASVGGTIFRRAPDGTNTYFGDALARTLSYSDSMQFFCKVNGWRQNVDSAMWFGFFNSTTVSSGGASGPFNSLGILVGGNTNDGHWMAPAYVTASGSFERATTVTLPFDQLTRGMMFRYDPSIGNGRLSILYRGQFVTQTLNAGARASGATFTHFGLWPQVNAEGGPIEVYFSCYDYTVT